MPWLLLAVGAAQSWIVFGHQRIPNPDFAEFLRVGEALWEWQLPQGSRRGPLLGFLQVGLGKLVGGDFPSLRGGWLLNALCHSLLLPLLWFWLRPLLRAAAAPVVLLVAFNPWLMQSLVQPLVEPALSLAIVGTLLLARRHSGWAFAVAGAAALLRWDGLACVLIAAWGFRGRGSLAGTAWRCLLASLPVLAWVGSLSIASQGAGGPSYRRDIAADKVSLDQSLLLLQTLERVVVQPLIQTAPTASGEWPAWAMLALRLSVVAAFALGAFRALRSRHPEILLACLYFGPYAMFLTLYWVVPRYASLFCWLILALTALGMRSALRILHTGGGPGRWISQWGFWGGVAAFAWWGGLLSPRLAKSATSTPEVPALFLLAAFAVVACAALSLQDRVRTVSPARKSLRGGRRVKTLLGTVALTTTLLASSQPRLVSLLGDGDYNAEYIEIARVLQEELPPEARIAARLTGILSGFAPPLRGRLVSLRAIPGSQLKELLAGCARRKIEWVAIQGRIDLRPGERPLVASTADQQLTDDPASLRPWRRFHRVDNPDHRSFVEIWTSTPSETPRGVRKAEENEGPPR